MNFTTLTPYKMTDHKISTRKEKKHIVSNIYNYNSMFEYLLHKCWLPLDTQELFKVRSHKLFQNRPVQVYDQGNLAKMEKEHKQSKYDLYVGAPARPLL